MIEKFEQFEKQKEKIPGIAMGLNFLSLHKKDLTDISVGAKDVVKFYDVGGQKFNYYDYKQLNKKITQIYDSEFIYRKLLIYNKLYIFMTYYFNEHLSNYKFSYANNIYNCYTIINKLFHSLRLNYEIEQKNFGRV